MSNEIGKSLKETILKSELPELINDLGEIGIDSLLTDGVLKDIPVLGSVLAIGKTYGNVRDYLFTKKLIKFLQELTSLSSEERISLIEKLETDSGYASNIGEKVIGILSRLDDDSKPSIIAKAFKLYAAGHLSYIQLQRINNAIERLLICDLGNLEEFCNPASETKITKDDPVILNFINSGLAYVASGFGAGGVHPTELAKLLIEVKNS